MRRKSLGTLRRLAHRRVDELRRAIVARETELAAVLAEDERLAARLAAEAGAAERMAGLVDFAAYAGVVKAKRAELSRQAREIEDEIAALRARLAEAFAEEKRYQILEERRLAEARRERERIEQARLDEIGLRRHAHGG